MKTKISSAPFWILVKRCSILLVCGVGLSISTAGASLDIKATRIIYPANESLVTLDVSNLDSNPILLQSWLDNGDMGATPETASVPFLISPPISLVEPNKGKTLKIIFNGKSLPQDRESVFWINMLEIPSKGKIANNENKINIAIRNRIKLFYRPTGLAGSPTETARDIKWSLKQNGNSYELYAKNSGRFHVSFNQLTLSVGATEYRYLDGGMIQPMQSNSFPIAGVTSIPSEANIKLSLITDYGSTEIMTFPLERP
jgi:chaperone protein EcpD